MTSEVEQVLTRVARRQDLCALGRSAFLCTGILAGLLAAAILGGRLLALWSADWLEAWMLLVLPVVGWFVGLLSEWLFRRRRDLSAAARITDDHQATEDLFLTDLQGSSAAGQYHALVESHARHAAGRVRPAEIVPLPFLPRAGIAAAALGLLWFGLHYLPQLDPFGAGEERMLLGQRTARLETETQQNKARQQALKEKPLDQRNSEDVDQALKAVVKTFRSLRKNGKQQNAQTIKQRQSEVGLAWRASRTKNQAADRSSPSLQRLGRLTNLPKFKKWESELAKGSAAALRRELKELRDLVNKLSAADPKDRAKIRKELKERTKDLADFLRNTASTRELNETLAKALNQLQGLGQPKLAEEAASALKQSFELSEMELKALAQSLRNMADLERAMDALQLARRANAEGKCGGEGQGKDGQGKDGEGKGGQDKDQDKNGGGQGDEPGLGIEAGMNAAEAMEAYRKYYEEMLAEAGEGEEPGPGMGGPGTGEGGVAPENPNQNNQFKTEKARSALKAGKILMNLKSKEAGDRGQVTREYAKKIRDVKQGVSEAILQERVPPGYHEGIKKYFDDLGDQPGGKDKKK